MVVNFMGMGDDVVLHSTRTIFTDVPSSHWARGYVNLAASTMLEDGGSSSGTGSDSDPKPAGTPSSPESGTAASCRIPSSPTPRQSPS